MQDRPTAQELLTGVRSFLEDDAIPGLTGAAQFRARVAANVVGMVCRELEHGEDDVRADHAALCALLDRDVPMPEHLDAVREQVLHMQEALTERIGAGDADAGPYRERVLAYLRATTLRKLAVTNPRLHEALLEDLRERE